MVLFSDTRLLPLAHITQITTSTSWAGPIAIIIVTTSLSYLVYLQLHSWSTKRLWTKKHGCQCINTRHHSTSRGLLFGIDLMYDSYRAAASRNFLSNTYSMYSRLGTTWSTRILGNTVIQTIDPENLRAVYNTNFRDWGFGAFRVNSFRPLLGNGIFAIEGSEWRHSRDLLRPAFAKSEVTNLQVYEKHFQQLLKAVPGSTGDDGVVDLQPLFFRLTMDSATEVIFGKSVHSLSTDDEQSSSARSLGQGYEKAKSEIFNNILLYPFGRWRWWSGLMSAVKKVHAYVDPIVEEAIATAQRDACSTAEAQSCDQSAGKKKPYSFLRELVSCASRDKIRGELLSVLLASRDTTASLLSNTMFILSRRPDIVSRLLDEIAPLAGQPPTYPQLRKLAYLDAVLKESLRLYPVAPTNTRIATRTTILPRGGGPDGTSPVFVAAGTQIVTSIYALHRDPKLWGPDADVFEPARWLPALLATCNMRRRTPPHPYAFLPFLAGPRQCPGQGLAMAEAGYVVVRLLQTFCSGGTGSSDGGIRCAPGEEMHEWVERLAVTCENLRGCRVVLRGGEAGCKGVVV
ncbi:cytochrome P450 [Phyllosticta citriasiana]|uniref:Cytochrome P450 n=1 Tax=Phyllosticta citriasiana TaxID=595635 RepID=A0ABR1KQI5_9PEZI